MNYNCFEYYGVRLNNARKGYKISYRAEISYNGKNKCIGTFKTAKEAAEHYDACARSLPRPKNGHRRIFNFPERSNWSHITLPKWILKGNLR